MASRPVDPKVKDVVTSGAPVIVASGTSQGITRSSQLAIVAFGPGEIFLRREEGKQATVTAHYLHGRTEKFTALVVNRQIRIPVILQHSTGVPLEWIDVQFS